MSADLGNVGLYVAFLVPPLLLGLAVQAWLRSTFRRYSQVPLANALSGAQVARVILDRNGLTDVPVQHAQGGPLSDYFDPRKRELHLSEPVYAPPTVSAAAVAAHESGHALQQARGYVPLRLRSAIFPVVAFASSAWIWLLLIGALLGALNLVALALVLYAVAVAFHIVTLPVEVNASRRASTQLRELGLVGTTEQAGVQKVLTAAALTYVAGALAALSQLLYYVIVFFGQRAD
jgi:Zn-dependent membrane protease YugP